MGEVQFARITRYQSVKVGNVPIRLGPQDSPQSLRFLLTGAEGTRYLNQHIRVRQVDREVADLRQDQLTQLALAEALVEIFTLGVGGLPGDERQVETLLKLAQLLEVLANDQHL